MTDQERNQLIAAKLGEGMSLSDLQQLLAQEYGIRMTYLDLRLLAADLPVTWSREAGLKTPTAIQATVMDDDEDTPVAGQTSVTVSKLVRPGAAMSGEVTFASGARGEWFVDTMGRLGLNPAPDSSRPTPEDVREFQVELQRKLSAMG